MSDVILVATPKAVLAALNDAPAATFSQRFSAERSYADWDEKLPDSGPLKVDVVLVSPCETELETRGSIGYKPGVDVVVRKRFPEAAQKESDGRIKNDEIDALVKFVQEINEFFQTERLGENDEAIWDNTKILAAYKPSHIRQHRQFTGIVRITFNANVDL